MRCGGPKRDDGMVLRHLGGVSVRSERPGKLEGLKMYSIVSYIRSRLV